MTGPVALVTTGEQLAISAAETAAQEILALVDPVLSAKAWAWLLAHSFTGFIGMAERAVLYKVWPMLFGPQPAATPPTTTTTVATP